MRSRSPVKIDDTSERATHFAETHFRVRESLRIGHRKRETIDQCVASVARENLDRSVPGVRKMVPVRNKVFLLNK